MRPSSGLRHGGHHPEGEEGMGIPRGDKEFLCLGGLCMMSHSSLAGRLWVRQFQRVEAAWNPYSPRLVLSVANRFWTVSLSMESKQALYG